MHPRRRNRQNVALLLLAMQMGRVGFNRIPPVTLATIASQVVIFLKLLKLRWPSIMDVCISPVTVWYREDYTRLALAAFFHVDEWHLYYNMASFLWKGMTLEKRLGSGYLLYLLAVFTLLCNTLTVGLGMLAEHLLHDPSYLSQCAVGFSGVIFALKVITTHMLPPGTHYLMGFIPVHSRLACWAELVLIQVLVPNASFIGHLAGILVGTAYCKGPLKNLMNMFIISPPSYTYVSAPSGSRYQASGRDRRFEGQGQASGYHTSHENQPRQPYNTRSRASAPAAEAEDYSAGLSEEEQMQRAMQASLRDTNQGSDRSMPSAPPSEERESLNDYSAPYPPPGAHNHPIPDPPPYPGRQGYRTDQHGDSGDHYTGTGHSASQRLYPDLRGVSNHTTHTGQSSGLDQDEVRRRRLAKFS